MLVAQCQTRVFADPEKNLQQAGEAIRAAAEKGADVVMFGEMFTCPYETANFPRYAEAEGEKTWTFLSRAAKESGVYLVAGSVPERDGKGLVYNTAYVFDRAGRQIAKHRKVHLFDIDVKGGQRFRESDTLTPGDALSVFDTEFGRCGLAICFDLRFPEWFRLLVRKGAEYIFVPAAFNQTTGPLHWELLFRARAVDNQCYFFGTSDALDETASYHAYGHSLAVDPWGKVLGMLGEEPGMLLTEIDAKKIREAREQLPVLSARRTDLYEVIRKGEKS
jgi:omega-amidase